MLPQLTIWHRRSGDENEGPVTKALQCLGCGSRSKTLKRCRYSREVCICSEACAAACKEEHKAILALRMVFLKKELKFSNLQQWKPLRAPF